MTREDNQLGSFLRTRREKIDAASAGVVDTTRRRVTGLRREELALLAGVSPSYYTRIEQGRDRHPSREILEAVARALRLDDTERAYLWSLATPALAPADAHAVPEHTVRPGMLRLLERWADLPAFVVAPNRDVLARHRAGRSGQPRVEPGTQPDRVHLPRSARAGGLPGLGGHHPAGRRWPAYHRGRAPRGARPFCRGYARAQRDFPRAVGLP
nr:helix-turn-helix transcriptional regulator [Fodinicola feengrottensis]